MIRQLVKLRNEVDISITWEARTPGAATDIELLLQWDGGSVGVEVKCPALLEHRRRRVRNDVQLTGRGPVTLQLAQALAAGGDVTLPRDSPMKDFLLSADLSFRAFGRSTLSSEAFSSWSGTTTSKRRSRRW